MKVLVVDDDGVSRQGLAAILAHQPDCEVLEAASGREALLLLETTIPDVIFLDVVMPSITGLQILSIIRREPATASVPVIMLSGAGDVATVKQAIGLGIVDFVTKPPKPERVLEKLRRVVQNRS